MTRNRSRMTPAQKQWDTINNPTGSAPVLDGRQRLGHLYRNLYRLGFGPFAQDNAKAHGAGHEYRVAQAALLGLVERLEAAP